jgi:hypothetical protein
MDRQNEMSTAQYWTERSAKMDAEIAAETEYARSRQGRIDALMTKLTTYDFGRAQWDTALAAEVAGWSAELDTLQAELKAEAEADFVAEWTRETTEARRAEWHALIKSGKLSKNGKPWWACVREQEREQGWTMDDLKAAVQRHGLSK